MCLRRRITTNTPRQITHRFCRGTAKGRGSRRLSWFADGLERGLHIESGRDGAYVVTAMAWRLNTPDDVTASPVSDGVALGALTTMLDGAIQAANALQP